MRRNKIKSKWTSGCCAWSKPLFIAAVVLVVNVAVSGVMHTALSAEAGKCAPDPKRTLHDFMAEPPNKIGHFDVVKTVPKDLIIDNSPVRVAVVNTVNGYVLPIEENNYSASYRLGSNARFLAICRIKDSNGSLWYVLRDKEGFLSYLSGRDILTEKEYDKEVEKENSERQKLMHK